MSSATSIATTETRSDQLGLFNSYRAQLCEVLLNQELAPIYALAEDLRRAWIHGKRVFICGNGGSAANAMHLANDLIYGISREDGIGIRVHALTAEVPILTCLANDESYAEVFAKQLRVQADEGDILIVLSGSGNSPNVVRALIEAKNMGLRTYAILGYSGGECKKLADTPIHFAIDDMQIAEDAQVVVGHMLMKWLCAHPIRSS